MLPRSHYHVTSYVTAFEIWLGASGAAFVAILVLGAPRLSHGAMALAAAAGGMGALVTGLVLAGYEHEDATWRRAVTRAFLAVLLGYPLLGLFLAGVAFIVVGPEMPHDELARWTAHSLGLYAPGAGVPMLAAFGALRARAWLRGRFSWSTKSGGRSATAMLVALAIFTVWTAGWARYKLNTPSRKDRALHARHAERQRAALHADVAETLRSVQAFLATGPDAARRASSVGTAEPAVTSALARCLDTGSQVMSCGLLRADGTYQMARRRDSQACGPGADADGELVQNGSGEMILARSSLSEHVRARRAAGSTAAWAEPGFQDDTRCAEISYVAPAAGAHWIVALSLGDLSERLRWAEEQRPAAPQWQAAVTDERGYVVGLSHGDLAFHSGASVGLCMVTVDCGTFAAQARSAALAAFATGRSDFTLPGYRYARWQGLGLEVPVPEGQPNPRWLLTAQTLGPDM